MAELVDAPVSKTGGGNSLPVRFRPSVPKKNMKQFLQVFVFLKPYKWRFIGALILGALYSTANVYFMPLARDLIDEIANKRIDNLTNQVLNAIVLYGIRTLTQFWQQFLTSKISLYMSVDIKTYLYHKMQNQSQTFYSKYKLGDLLSRIFSDVDHVRNAIVLTFSKVFPQTLTFISVLGYLFYLNWKLTLFTILVTPIFIQITNWASQRMKKTTHQAQRKSADITHIAQETLSNIKLVQAYTMEDSERNKFKRENMRSAKAILAGLKVKFTSEPIISYIQFIAIAFVIWYGGFEVAKGNLTGSELTAFFTGIMLLIDPIIALSAVYTEVQKAQVSIQRVYEIIDHPNDINYENTPIIMPNIKGEVTFNNVSFKYTDTGKDVLKDISFTAKQGKTIALVGLSGAGKTTLINLIPRFYNVSKGNITIDGNSLNDIELKSLRSQISIVPQEDIIFRGTISENVRYGKTKEEVKESDIINALKLANAWEFIEPLPRGIYEKVGDKGRLLSGGQKQRLSIARAILNNPKILILDEATSALDSKSEALVQDALKTLMKDRTSFVIAHRLSTIIHADSILMMEQGRIIEIGTHDELLKNKGSYFELFNIQYNKNIIDK